MPRQQSIQGKEAEIEFRDRISELGKAAYLHRLLDAANVYGRTGVAGRIPPQPADWVLTEGGGTLYAEVKSTEHPERFLFSLLRRGQSSAAEQILAAGGFYDVFVKSLALNRWYRIPLNAIRAARVNGRGSFRWSELEDFSWT